MDHLYADDRWIACIEDLIEFLNDICLLVTELEAEFGEDTGECAHCDQTWVVRK